MTPAQIKVHLATQDQQLQKAFEILRETVKALAVAHQRLADVEECLKHHQQRMDVMSVNPSMSETIALSGLPS